MSDRGMPARQLFPMPVASSMVVRSTTRRCTMRSLGLLISLTLLASTALVAQHATTMPPPAVHIAAPAPVVTTPAAIHTSAPAPHVSAPHVSETHGSASVTHAAAQTPRVATVKTNAARISDVKPNPEKHGLFSWLRKCEPKNRHKEVRNPSTDYLAQRIPPPTSYVHHGCTVVPVSNPAIPCNPFAPCCD